MLRDQLRGKLLHVAVQRQVVPAPLFGGELFHIALENPLSGVGQGIDGVTHAVYKPLPVEGFLIDDLREIILQSLLVRAVGDVQADVLHHFHDLDVGTAVLGAFQGGHSRRDGGIGVGTGGGDDTGGEGGIVAAAVLHVENQRRVQDLRFRGGVFFVGAKHHQKIFRCGKGGVRPVNDHAVHIFIVVVGMVSVNGQQREFGDQLDALPEGIADAGVDGALVVGRQRQNAPGHGVHDVLAGGFHDDVPGEVGGERPALTQQPPEFFRGGAVRHLSHEQKIGDLFVAKLRFPKAADQVFHPVAPVPELAVAGNLFAVHNFGGRDLGNVRQSGENAVAVFVPKPLFDTVFLVQPGGDGVVPAAHRLAAGRVVI